MDVKVKNQRQQEYWLLRIPSQNEYETELREFLEEYVEKLNLSKTYKQTSFGIYQDILNSLESTSDENKFNVFYDSLNKIKGTRYVSASLLLIAFFKNGININQKDLADLLDIHNRDNISKVFNSLLSYLKSHQDYSFIYRFIPVKTLTTEEYKIAVIEHINYFSKFLIKQELIDRKEINFILFLFTKYNKKIHENKDRIYLKHPKYIASTICWIYLIYYKDYDIPAKEFINIIHLKKDVRFTHNKSLFETIPNTNPCLLSKSKKDFVEKVFTFDIAPYKSKVVFYTVSYIRTIKGWILHSFSKENIYDMISNYLETELLRDILGLFDIAIENGFKINYIASNRQIYYYFPQTMALTLIFYSSRANHTLQKILNVEFFKKFITLDPSLRFFKGSFRYITETENRLYPFIKEEIGRYKGQVYSKESFKKKLTAELQRFYHLETDFMLKLYNMTDLSPFEFGNRLNIHSGRGVTSILQIVNNKSKFTEPKTFQNIRNFIMKNLKTEDRKKSLLWLNNLRSLRYNDFRHGSITYSFKWIRNKYTTFMNSSLYRFLFKIWKGNYPRHIFVDPNNTRASNLKFHGTKEEHVKTDVIEQYFSNFLEIHDSNYYLCRHVRSVFSHYKINKIGKQPDYPPILNYILSEENKALAIEIPVWKERNNLGNTEYFIGHIDLLLVEGNTLIIADYKPKLREIYKSLPQITAYAIFLRDRLENYNKNLNLKIKCVGFTRDQALEWNPETIFPKIIEFVEKRNKNRKNNLLTANRKTKKDLQKELRKLKF